MPISLEVLDTAILEQTQFGPDMNRWITNVVDIINGSFTILSNAINNLITVATIDIGGSGAGPINVTVVGLTASMYVYVNLLSTSNTGVTVSNVVAGTDQFSVTFSADPGTHAIIAYQAYTSQP